MRRVALLVRGIEAERHRTPLAILIFEEPLDGRILIVLLRDGLQDVRPIAEYTFQAGFDAVQQLGAVPINRCDKLKSGMSASVLLSDGGGHTYI